LENGFLSSNSGFRGKFGMMAVLGLEGDSDPHALHGDLSMTAPQFINTDAKD